MLSKVEDIKVVEIEDAVEFFNKCRHEKALLLFYDRERNGEPVYSFCGDDCTIYKCKGYKAEAYFRLLGNKVKVFSERTSYEVAE